MPHGKGRTSRRTAFRNSWRRFKCRSTVEVSRACGAVRGIPAGSLLLVCLTRVGLGKHILVKHNTHQISIHMIMFGLGFEIKSRHAVGFSKSKRRHAFVGSKAKQWRTKLILICRYPGLFLRNMCVLNIFRGIQYCGREARHSLVEL